jgi:hypothetical protein
MVRPKAFMHFEVVRVGPLKRSTGQCTLTTAELLARYVHSSGQQLKIHAVEIIAREVYRA